GLADLGDDAQPEQHTHQPDQQLCAHRATPAGALSRTGPAGRLAVMAGRAGALRCLGCLAGTAVLSRHALKTCRRMEAALEKIRMPSTTTTAVLSWDPTPSWSPRNTSRAAITTLNRKEVTNTRSSKTPSSRARTAPKRASSAATTAIGRYGCSSTGTEGCRMRPSTTPTSRPATAIIAPSLRRPRSVLHVLG